MVYLFILSFFFSYYAIRWFLSSCKSEKFNLFFCVLFHNWDDISNYLFHIKGALSSLFFNVFLNSKSDLMISSKPYLGCHLSSVWAFRLTQLILLDPLERLSVISYVILPNCCVVFATSKTENLGSNLN